MKRYFFLLFLLLPVFAHAESIELFDSTITINKDGSFVVEEDITYRFTEERHGIFREIPLIHPEKASSFLKKRFIEIELSKITMDEKDIPYVLESTADTFIARIGDPNATISGDHTYSLVYTVRGGISYPVGQGAELYWNVTGNEWPVPIRTAEATLVSPDGLFQTARSCYRGTFGATAKSCAVGQNEDGSIFFRTTGLFNLEGMTVAQALNPAKLTKDVRERTNVLLLVFPLLGIGLLYGIYRLYRYRTANKTGRTIIPEYEPYPDTKPMYAGLLMDGHLDPYDLTAGIVYLAEQGYLKIRKTERTVLFMFDVDDYEIDLVKVPDEAVGKFERKVLEMLFSVPLTAGATVSLFELKTNVIERSENNTEFINLQQELREDLQQSGFFEHWSIERILITVGIGIAAGVVVALIVGTQTQMEGFFPVSILSVLLSALFVSILYRRRTRKGYEALDHLKGFKLFLEMTDRDRFAFHNAPEKSPEQFMEYLPYAIAFGVEKEWAKVFEGITIPNPGWYDGGTAGSFSSSSLSTSLGAFSTAFASSSGSSSGSSGGGSSGGGAGGGGGGSW